MSFSDVSDLLLTYIVTYGAIVLSAVEIITIYAILLPLSERRRAY